MQTHVEFVPEIEFRYYPGNIPTNPNSTIERLVHNSTSDANRPNSQMNEVWLQNKIMSTSNHAAQWKNREDERLVKHICTNCT